MTKTLCLTSVLIFTLIGSVKAQVPLSQVEGYLELYIPTDTTSLYLGRNAGQKTSNTFVRKNVFVGNNAGKENISGRDNVFIGNIVGQENTTGSFNVFIGEGAGSNNKSGGDNAFIGEGAGFSNVSGYDNVYLGYGAGFSDTNGQSNTYVGHNAGGGGDSTQQNSFFGFEAGEDVEGDFNTYLGAYAGVDASIGDYNTVVGYSAGEQNEGEENTFVGGYAGEENQGSENTFIGFLTGEENEGDRNTFVGHRSGVLNTIGSRNAFFGVGAGFANGDGNFNTFLGNEAGVKNVSGSRNIFVGSTAGKENIAGDNQVFIGQGAGVSSKSGQHSVVIGNGAAFNDTAIQSSVYIGHLAGQLSPGLETNRTGNVFIGNFAGTDIAESNRLFVSNSSVGKTEALIYGEFDGAGKLRVNGDLHIAANAATGNSRVFMKGIGGQLNEIIRYDGDQNDIVMGSVTGAGGKLFLRANANTRMAIIENGNVGIGNNNPVHKLQVAGTGHFDDDITTGGNVIGDKIVGDNVNTGTLFVSNAPIGSSTTDLRLDGSGQVIRSSSDVRLKKDIFTIPDALSKVLQLRGVQYLWKQDTVAGVQLGVIAQEVMKVVPEIVNESDGFYGVDYSETAGLFIEAIKEQQSMIDKQDEQIKIQQAEIDSLKNKMTEVLSQISKE